MYLLAKFGVHRSNGNEDINSCMNFYMHTSEKADLTSPIHHIERFSKSAIPIYNFEVPDTLVEKQQ